MIAVLSISASCGGGETEEDYYSGQVCPDSPGPWMPAELPNGEVGAEYVVEITAENWDDRVSAFVDGLPAGLRDDWEWEDENGSGVHIVGNPTEAGVFTVTVATISPDGGYCWPDKDYRLTINR